MNEPVRIENRSVSEIKAALETVGVDLPPEQLKAVELFVQKIGGISNARMALAMLADLEKAA
jgi:hypothetical protein